MTVMMAPINPESGSKFFISISLQNPSAPLELKVSKLAQSTAVRYMATAASENTAVCIQTHCFFVFSTQFFSF